MTCKFEDQLGVAVLLVPTKYQERSQKWYDFFGIKIETEETWKLMFSNLSDFRVLSNHLVDLLRWIYTIFIVFHLHIYVFFLLCIEMKAFVYHVHTLSFPSGGVRSTGKIMDLGHHATCSGYSNLPSYVFFYAITYGFAFMDIFITAAHQGISLSWLYLFFKNVFFNIF
jgi:hypothetical protein